MLNAATGWKILPFWSPPTSSVRDIVSDNCARQRSRKHHAQIPSGMLIGHLFPCLYVHIAELWKALMCNSQLCSPGSSCGAYRRCRMGSEREHRPLTLLPALEVSPPSSGRWSSEFCSVLHGPASEVHQRGVRNVENSFRIPSLRQFQTLQIYLELLGLPVSFREVQLQGRIVNVESCKFGVYSQSGSSRIVNGSCTAKSLHAQ